MIGFHIVPQGEHAAVWRVDGIVRYTASPKRLFLFRDGLKD